MKFFNAILILILSILLLSACGKSNFKNESKEIVEAVKEALNEKTKEPNKKSGDINFYLPFGYEIEDESANNVILKNGSKQYILFNNPQESKMSDVVYKSTVAQNKELAVNEQFKKSGQFGIQTGRFTMPNLFAHQSQTHRFLLPKGCRLLTVDFLISPP